MSYSNLPPGCRESDIPGYNDHEVSFTAYLIIHSQLDKNHPNDEAPDSIKLIDHALQSVKQNYLSVVGDPTSLVIDEVDPDYISYHFTATVEGDTTIDMTYIHDDDTEILSEISNYIYEELASYNIYDDEIDMDSSVDIEYEVYRS